MMAEQGVCVTTGFFLAKRVRSFSVELMLVFCWHTLTISGLISNPPKRCQCTCHRHHHCWCTSANRQTICRPPEQRQWYFFPLLVQALYPAIHLFSILCRTKLKGSNLQALLTNLFVMFPLFFSSSSVGALQIDFLYLYDFCYRYTGTLPATSNCHT